MVELANIGYTVRDREILRDVSLEFAPGVLSVVLGPNGAGKSTLLRIAAGLLAPGAGEVRYGARPVGAFSASELARTRALLSQHGEPAFPLRAEEVVEMGRYPHFDRVPTRRDREAVDRALEVVEMRDRRAQSFATLSAGERQKIQMARVLAQIDADDADGDRVLFLDEPTSSLDVHHQLQLLRLARSLLAKGVTVIAVLHDLNLACEFGDRFYLLEGGRLAHDGGNAASLSEALIERVYRVSAHRVRDPQDGRDLWRFGL